MQPLLLDTCVILDILDSDSHWHTWAKVTLRELRKKHAPTINPIIFSELSAGMESPQAVLNLLKRLGIDECPLNHESLFLAAKAYLQYRKQGGKKTGVLPDFYIGAQAAVHNWPLISRDKGRYTSYFPSVNIIMPAAH